MAFFEFPHTRTYDSDLGWLIHAYQLLKAQADDIQGSIQQIVDDTLNDPTYVARVLAVLAPLNVKYPPSKAGLNAAKGDGVTDDTDAITGMIAYAYEHNMPLLFPAGQYVVSGLTVSNNVTFIGLGGTLFLKAGAVNPLITVKGGYLTATGLEFNGNIAGQTAPKNVLVVDGGGFKLDNCVITGGVDAIHADIDTHSFLSAVDISKFTEYGIYVEGSSFINANGITMDVASGGALRLIRVDASNCIFNGIESLAEVEIAFEVTGDFNYFLARVPNAETPISDGGQNNNFEIINQLSKRTYQNLSEKVAGDYTQEVGDFDGTATGHYTFNAPDIVLNPDNPLTYKTPTPTDGELSYILLKDKNNDEYAVPTTLAKMVMNLGYKNFKTIFDFGAVGDGVTDDTNAFIAALNSDNAVIIPSGSYYCNDITVPESGVQSCFITAGNLNFTNKTPLEIPTTYATVFRTNESDEKPYKNYIVGIFENTGGTRGNVQSPLFINSLVRNETLNFIWGIVSQLTVEGAIKNSAEHVGIYSQIKGSESDTGMWALCGDLQNDAPGGNPSASKIGLELTYRAAESDDNNMRVGIHIAFNPTPGATGAQMFAGLFLSGRFGHEGPSTDMKYALCLNSIAVDRIIGADISKGGAVKASIGIDFTNIDIVNSAINLDKKVLQFGNSTAQETADGALNFKNENGTIAFNAENVNVAGNVISKGVGSGAPSGSPVGYIPVTIDGTPLKIPLYIS